MRYHINFPCRDRLAHQHKLICPGILLLIHLYREIMHLRRHVSKHLVLFESIHHTIYRDLKQLRPGTYFLRHDNGPEFPVFLIRYRSRDSNRSRSRHVSRLQINQRLSFGIRHQHLFLQSRPLSFGKPLSFHKRHPCRTHFMPECQADHFCRRSHLLCFSPKKITRLVTSQIPILPRFRLILLYLESVLTYTLLRIPRIIPVHIYRSFRILPVNIIRPTPFIIGFIVSKLHIRSPISFQFQFSGFSPFVVHDINPNHVLITKSPVIHPRQHHLINFPG